MRIDLILSNVLLNKKCYMYIFFLYIGKPWEFLLILIARLSLFFNILYVLWLSVTSKHTGVKEFFKIQNLTQAIVFGLNATNATGRR